MHILDCWSKYIKQIFHFYFTVHNSESCYKPPVALLAWVLGKLNIGASLQQTNWDRCKSFLTGLGAYIFKKRRLFIICFLTVVHIRLCNQIKLYWDRIKWNIFTITRRVNICFLLQEEKPPIFIGNMQLWLWQASFFLWFSGSLSSRPYQQGRQQQFSPLVMVPSYTPGSLHNPNTALE